MILPVHPQPFEDELLSSWMVRLSLSNGWHLHTFYSKVLGYNGPIWNRDIDRFQQPELYSCLSNATHVDITKIKELSLHSYYGILFANNPDAANHHWIMPIGVYHRIRRCAGLQVCPICLRKDSVPRYRKHWRLAFVSICHIHKVKLIDRCPFCGAIIEFHRLGLGTKNKFLPDENICLCHKCGGDLRGAEADGLDCYDGNTITSYIELLDRFYCGVPDIGNETFAMSLSYYEGLRVLVKTILHPYARSFRRYVSNVIGCNDELSTYKHKQFEYYPVQERLNVMLMLCWILDDWPRRLYAVAEKGLIKRTAISEDLSRLPYWLYKQVDACMPNALYIPSKDEMVSVLSYVARKHSMINKKILSEEMGVSENSAYFYLSKMCRLYNIQINYIKHKS